MSRDGGRIAGLWIAGSLSLGGYALLMWAIRDRLYAQWVAVVLGIAVLALKWHVLGATEEWIRDEWGDDG